MEGLEEAILGTEIEFPRDKIDKDKAAEDGWKYLKKQVQDLWWKLTQLLMQEFPSPMVLEQLNSRHNKQQR